VAHNGDPDNGRKPTIGDASLGKKSKTLFEK
jgi:hypothetical protein